MSGISIADKSGAFASLLGLGLAPNWSKIEIKRIKLSGGAVLIEYVSISSQTEHHIKSNDVMDLFPRWLSAKIFTF